MKKKAGNLGTRSKTIKKRRFRTGKRSKALSEAKKEGVAEKVTITAEV
jgi:hypothetical protein